MTDLSGRVALVTGAARGVGQAVAIALSAAGADCVLLAREAGSLEQTTRRMARSPHTILGVDLCDGEALEAAMAALCATAPPDIFVHCAAPMFTYEKIHAASAQVLDTQLQVNARAAFQVAQHLLPEMMLRRWGRVVLMGSLSARRGDRGAAAYSMSKAALGSLARSITLEYARYQVTANTLVLGPIDGERLRARDAESPGARQRALQHAPARRLPTPEQVAGIVTFLCSPPAAAINGASIDVSCGIHLQAR